MKKDIKKKRRKERRKSITEAQWKQTNKEKKGLRIFVVLIMSLCSQIEAKLYNLKFV